MEAVPQDHRQIVHPLFPQAVQAIATGDRDALARLLDSDGELATARGEDPTSPTLLHYTSFNGMPEVCANAPRTTPQLARLLIERGAEVDAIALGAASNTALCWALSSWFTHAGGVQLALADAYLDGGAAINGIDGDCAPIGHAIGFGYTAAVELLARRGARVDNLPAACALDHRQQLSAWLQGDGFSSACMKFARSDEPERGRFSWPLANNPDPMSLALITAATHGRAALVHWLLQRGADPSASIAFDQTALHFAAYTGHADVVTILLASGARPDVRERQFDRTPADWARETNENAIAACIEDCES